MCRLGSRLFYEFTAAALSDGMVWERLLDSVAVEVRRHGAPAAQAPQPPAEGEAAAPPAMILAPAALAAVPLSVREGTAPDVGVSSVVHSRSTNNTHNNYIRTNTSNSGTNNTNFGNTSIVLM